MVILSASPFSRFDKDTMNVEQIRTTITQVIHRVVTERGHDMPELTGVTVLLGGDVPIDSLDLATIVVELESRFGKDPFKDGFIEFRTLDELVALYVP